QRRLAFRFALGKLNGDIAARLAAKFFKLCDGARPRFPQTVSASASTPRLRKRPFLYNRKRRRSSRPFVDRTIRYFPIGENRQSASPGVAAAARPLRFLHR